jgi:hypothetical protein
MITDLISFDTTGLLPQPAPPPERRWATERGLTVLLTVDERMPEFPATAAGEAAVRHMYRDVSAVEGVGLVEFTFHRVDGFQARRMVLKLVTDPATGWGRTFIGLLHIPVASACVALRVECSEAGPTGNRETTVVFHQLRSGVLKLPEGLPEGSSTWLGPGDLEPWIVDPNDPTPAHVALNVSDDRQYDAEFPNHPLSLVRAFLDRTQSSMSLARASAEASKTKSWWKVW